MKMLEMKKNMVQRGRMSLMGAEVVSIKVRKESVNL